MTNTLLPKANSDELRAVQRKLKEKIREGKNGYRRKKRGKAAKRNTNGVWRGLKWFSQITKS